MLTIMNDQSRSGFYKIANSSGQGPGSMTESLSLDRSDFISARSDGMAILTGRVPLARSVTQKHDHHQILIPGPRASALITHPTAAGLQEQTRRYPEARASAIRC